MLRHSIALRGFYAIIDPERCLGRDPLWVAAEALNAGAGILQFRDKRRARGERIDLAVELRKLCAEAEVPFIVNDDPVLALTADADGLHVGQEDMTVGEAHAILGPGRIIGLSTHTREQALAGQTSGADYLGFGPAFATPTKEQPYAPLGVEEMRWAAETLKLPFVAIGGITAENLPPLVAAGVRCAAAIGAICGAPDPGAASRAFVEVFERRP